MPPEPVKRLHYTALKELFDMYTRYQKEYRNKKCPRKSHKLILTNRIDRSEEAGNDNGKDQSFSALPIPAFQFVVVVVVGAAVLFRDLIK